MGDHAEAIEVVFDPTVIGYAQLLEHFWSGHRPTSPPWSNQYRSAIFVHGEAQREAAERSVAAHARKLGVALHTEVEQAGPFTEAEAYHQKYRLKGSEVARAFAALYPDDHAWVGSTAAARLNGWVAGHADPATFASELAEVGLPTDVQRAIAEGVRSGE